MKETNESEDKRPIGQVKGFTVNFQHLALASSANELLVLDNAQFSTIDVSFLLPDSTADPGGPLARHPEFRRVLSPKDHRKYLRQVLADPLPY